MAENNAPEIETETDNEVEAHSVLPLQELGVGTPEGGTNEINMGSTVSLAACA